MNEEQSIPGITRSTTNRVVAGVAGGLADHFQIDPAYLRMAFVVSSLLWGIGILGYALLWIVLPSASREQEDPQPPLATDQPQIVLGILLLGLGLILIMWKVLSWLSFGVLLPAALIAMGLFFLSRRR